MCNGDGVRYPFLCREGYVTLALRGGACRSAAALPNPGPPTHTAATSGQAMTYTLFLEGTGARHPQAPSTRPNIFQTFRCGERLHAPHCCCS